jgi:hypothetical protein
MHFSSRSPVPGPSTIALLDNLKGSRDSGERPAALQLSYGW